MCRPTLATLPLILALAACAPGSPASAPESSQGSTGADAPVQVFAAASLGAVGDELIAAYRQENPQADITATYAGSSQLVTQMTEGATPDLLMTADNTTMTQAIEKVEELAGVTPETIATNALVLATAPGNPAAIDSVDDLAASGVMTAICAQEVPCGRLAHQELTRQGMTPATSTEEAGGCRLYLLHRRHRPLCHRRYHRHRPARPRAQCLPPGPDHHRSGQGKRPGFCQLARHL